MENTDILNMKIFKRVYFILLFASGLFSHAFSQKQMLAGLNINGEIYSGGFIPAIGLTFEKQLTRHSGLETGLFYRTWKSSGVITYMDASGFFIYSLVVSQRHLSIPVLYKYYSNSINFSAGPTLDFYVGWKQKNRGSTVYIKDFSISPKVTAGFLGKVSKAFTLRKRLILEPEIRLEFIRTLNNAGYGVGIAGKYKL